MLMHARIWQPLIQAWGRVWACACVCLLCGEAPAGVEGGVAWGRRGMRRRRRRRIADKAGDLGALTFTPHPPLLVSVSLRGPRQDEAVVHTLHAKEWNGVRRIFCKLKDLPNIWANHSFYLDDWRFRTSSTRKVSTNYQNDLRMNGNREDASKNVLHFFLILLYLLYCAIQKLTLLAILGNISLSLQLKNFPSKISLRCKKEWVEINNQLAGSLKESEKKCP